MRAQLHRVHNFARVVDAGQHDDFHAGLHLAQLLQRLQAVDAGHEHVEQHQVGLQTFFHELQGFFAGGRGLDFVVVDFEQRFDVAQHAGFVIDQQDFGGWLHRFFPLLAARSGRFVRDQERKFAACAGITLHPDLASHALHQAARDGETQSHAFLSFGAGKAEEIVKNFQVELRREFPGPVSETLTFTELG